MVPCNAFCLSNRYQIIKYPNSWAYTYDLANSVYVRGELSNHCMEVGIEYLQTTNKIEGKMIMPYQLSNFLRDGQFQKKLVVTTFQRTEVYSLSVMKLVSSHFYCVQFISLFVCRFRIIISL